MNIYDIADKAGVSIATVSRVINNEKKSVNLQGTESKRLSKIIILLKRAITAGIPIIRLFICVQVQTVVIWQIKSPI